MNNSSIEVIKEQLSSKITVYVDKDTFDSLQKDCRDFEAKNPNNFINRLVKNYVSDYFSSIYKAVPEIQKVLESNGYDDRNNIQEIAKLIAFTKNGINKINGNLNKKLNIKLNNSTVNKAIEALYYGPASLDISAFFRSMFLSYLSFPVYKRERIIYKEELERIEGVIRNNEKLSYVNKEKNQTHVLNPYSVEPSSHELFNYLIGESGNSRNIVSIRLSNIKDIFAIHEKREFSERFDPYFERMKRNGIQFGINKPDIFLITLNEKQYEGYWKKYLDRPEIIKEDREGDLHKCYFDCSDFQLKTFFLPFEEKDNKIEIKKVKIE